MFDWLVEAFSMSDKEVRELAGDDILIFITSLKYNAILFFIMFLIGGLPMMSIYVSMANSEKEANLSFLEKITIKSYVDFGNFGEKSVLVYVIFIFYIIFITLGHV